MTAWLRVHAGSQSQPGPVDVIIRIFDAQGRMAIETVERVPVSGLASSRMADLEWGLPLDRLAPGPFLLTMDVAGGATPMTRRALRFQVTH